MDKQEIVDLYREYRDNVDTRIHKDKELYHQEYKDMQRDVKAMRVFLNNGGKLDKNEHSEFLKRLVTDFYAAIANAGKGGLAAEDRDVIRDDNVLWAIERVIKNPNSETGDKLEKGINLCLRKNKYLIANRILAACTSDVSSTVDCLRFSLTLRSLIDDKVIGNYSDKCTLDFKPNNKGGVDFVWNKKMRVAEWYNENFYLIKELRKIIEDGDGKEPEAIHLATFPWYIWKKKLADFFSESVSPDYY